MFAGKNKIWLSTDRKTYWSWEGGLGRLQQWVNGTNVAYWTTSGLTAAALTATGGVAPAAATAGFANWQPLAATSGTDVFWINGTQYVTSIFVPCNKTLTGVAYLLGSVGGTDKVYAVLYSAAGAVLANSTLTASGTTAGTAANIQTLAFTATYAAVGPAMYFVGLSGNTGTAKLRTVLAQCQNGIYSGTISQAHGTVAAITVPSAFAADTAPICFLY